MNWVCLLNARCCRALAELSSEFEGLEAEGARLEAKMDLRTKQFHLLLHTVQDLQNIIKSEEENDASYSMQID